MSLNMYDWNKNDSIAFVVFMVCVDILHMETMSLKMGVGWLNGYIDLYSQGFYILCNMG